MFVTVLCASYPNRYFKYFNASLMAADLSQTSAVPFCSLIGLETSLKAPVCIVGAKHLCSIDSSSGTLVDGLNTTREETILADGLILVAGASTNDGAVVLHMVSLMIFYIIHAKGLISSLGEVLVWRSTKSYMKMSAAKVGGLLKFDGLFGLLEIGLNISCSSSLPLMRVTGRFHSRKRFQKQGPTFVLLLVVNKGNGTCRIFWPYSLPMYFWMGNVLVADMKFLTHLAWEKVFFFMASLLLLAARTSVLIIFHREKVTSCSSPWGCSLKESAIMIFTSHRNSSH